MKSLIQILLLFGLFTGVTWAETEPKKPQAQNVEESAAKKAFESVKRSLTDEDCIGRWDMALALKPGLSDMAAILEICDANLVSDDELSRSAAYVSRRSLNALRDTSLIENFADKEQIGLLDKYKWKNEAEFVRLSNDPDYRSKRVPTYGALVERFQAAAEQREPDQGKFKTMVGRLASPNKKPGFYPDKAGRGPGYPKDYDETAQRDVWRAYKDLDEAGPAAFPQLLEHVDDDRYSMTVDGGADEINRNVGFICRWILEKKISPFAYHVAGEGYTRGSVADDTKVIGPLGDPPARPSFFEHLMKDREKAKEWLNERQTYPLRIIQQEVLEWMIEEEEKDTKKFKEVERGFLRNLLRDLKESDSHIESSRVFFSR